MIIRPAALLWLFVAASEPTISSATPKKKFNKMATKSCGINGNPKKCQVDTSDIDIDQPDGTISEIDLGNGIVYSCKARRGNVKKQRSRTYHGSCSVKGKEKPGDDGDGDLNMVTRGKNSRGEDCITASLSVDGQICQIRPDETCDSTFVECQPASSYNDELDPLVPGNLKEVHVGSKDEPVTPNYDFRRLVVGPADEPLEMRSGLRGAATPADARRDLLDDSGGNLDVMVVWSKGAECKASGQAPTCTTTAQTEYNMRGLVDLSVLETNTAYSLSGIQTQLRLVHAYRDPSYAEVYPEALSAALNHITTNGDGFLDDVHAKRITYGADLVAMIADDPNYCGIAWGGPSYSLMFSVTSYACVAGYYSFGHEIAHNLGCNHDRGTERACSSTTSYAYGYRDPQAAFRTILSYNCEPGLCDNNIGGGCPRIQRFSSSTLTYNGRAFGDAYNDNARQINSVRATVAAYATFVPDCLADSDCNDSNSCTIDTCDGVCAFTPINCDDNNKCTNDYCSNGSCINAPINCDDGNACTLDSCNPITGCVNTLINGCCGNQICEPGSGEDKVTCPVDCDVGPFTLTTTLCNTCYVQDGNMFDVKTKDAPIKITSLKIFVYSTGSKTEVWTKAGGHVGSEYSSSAWTKVADTFLNAAPWSFVDVPITPVSIPANTRQGFYVTMDTSGDLLYHSGSRSLYSVVAEDDKLIIYEGPVKQYPFGQQSSPRVFNGEFTYMKADGMFSSLGQTTTPTKKPTPIPTSSRPTALPSTPPTKKPTALPSTPPTKKPTPLPSTPPTKNPTPLPSTPPTKNPTPLPSTPPSKKPTGIPTPNPTNFPTHAPTTAQPVKNPTTLSPTNKPTPFPTHVPTALPTSKPTALPSALPTRKPTALPSSSPTSKPTALPSTPPTKKPTAPPSTPPTIEPTAIPTANPTSSPTVAPTLVHFEMGPMTRIMDEYEVSAIFEPSCEEFLTAELSGQGSLVSDIDCKVVNQQILSQRLLGDSVIRHLQEGSSLLIDISVTGSVDSTVQLNDTIYVAFAENSTQFINTLQSNGEEAGIETFYDVSTPTNAPTPLPTSTPTANPTQTPTSSPFGTVTKYICMKDQPDIGSICASSDPVPGAECATHPEEDCAEGGHRCWVITCIYSPDVFSSEL